MTFDPFGDFATLGYLRNFEKEKDLAIVKRAENASFTLASDGTLKTAASFDYETKSSYSVRVRSTDQGGLWTEQTFTISVTNVNETPTDISLDHASVAENQAAGTAVGQLTTLDPDAGNTFTYTLVSGTGSDDNASFTVAGDGTMKYLVTDLGAGTWQVWRDGKIVRPVILSEIPLKRVGLIHQKGTLLVGKISICN